IEFLGRTDNQVKIRGFRVGLEEVESALVAHPAITACAVSAKTDSSAELRLTAYLSGPALNTSDVPAIRDFLRQMLPACLVPPGFMILSASPMTPSGKVDRKKLPEPQTLSAAEATEPRDPLEAALAGIWKNVLGLNNVGVHDNFFDLGGHSLLASML